MPRLLVHVVACLAVALAGTPAQARLSEQPRALEQMVWLPHWSMSAALGSVLSTEVFSVASPFWYDAAGCGRVVGASGAGSTKVIGQLRARGLTVLPTITASGLHPEAAIRCLGKAKQRRSHVAALLRVVLSRTAYAGVDIDYEHLALTTRRPQAKRVRVAFTRFAEDLCAALHERGKVCHITVMPRTSGRLSVWRGKLIPAVFDYARLGAVADRVRVMAYDQHARAFGPGPIAGMPWVRRTAAYSLSQIPADRLVLGIPTYARDFSRGDSRSLTTRQALALARQVGARVRHHPKQREGVFSYRRGGVRHTVWVSTKRAARERAALARELGLAGTAYWAAGMEQPGTWSAVAGD